MLRHELELVDMIDLKTTQRKLMACCKAVGVRQDLMNISYGLKVSVKFYPRITYIWTKKRHTKIADYVIST
jgi:hypothetical protein